MAQSTDTDDAVQKSAEDLPTVEKQQIKRTSNVGTFLRFLLLCVLLTGSIALFICWYFYGKDNSSKIILEDVLSSSKKPEAGNTIFFHKSNPYFSGDQSGVKVFKNLVRHPDTFRVQITPSEACAIESAAIHNPDQDIFVLYESPVAWVTNSKHGLMSILCNISNVHLRSLNLKRYIANSPFESLNGPMEAHRSLWSKTSELLGFLTLWRYGGTYLDLDTITLRNLDDLDTNFGVIVKETEELSASVFNFAPMGAGCHVAKNLAHKIAKILKNTCGIDLAETEGLGSELLTEVYRKVCRTKDLTLMKNRLKCFGLRVYDQEQIYGMPSIFNASKLEELEDMIVKNNNNWYVTYNWKQFNRDQNLMKIFSKPYAMLAEENCPKTFAYVQLYERYLYGTQIKSKIEEEPNDYENGSRTD